KLVAYLVPGANAVPPDARALRAFLANLLPDYMVPSAFVWLEKLPVTANGKLDLRALPNVDRTRPELDTPFAAPTTPLERTLCALWAELLQLDSVGALDNFFALGGSSLLAIRTVARLEREHGVTVPVALLFEHPTAASLAKALESHAEAPQKTPARA